MSTNIADLYASIPGLKADYKVDWKEDARNDWRVDWDSTPGMPPVNSVLPVISGTPQNTQVLSVTAGTWSGSPTYTYQWSANGVAVSGATSSSYTCITADIGKYMSCRVTAKNANGHTVADAVAVGPVAA